MKHYQRKQKMVMTTRASRRKMKLQQEEAAAASAENEQKNLSPKPSVFSANLHDQNRSSFPPGFAPSACKLQSKSVSAWPVTANSPSVAESPAEGKSFSVAAVEMWPLGRAKRVPCRREKSTAAACIVKKETEVQEAGIHLGVETSEDLHNVELLLTDGTDCTQTVHPSCLAIEAVNEKLVSVDVVASHTTNCIDDDSLNEATMAPKIVEDRNMSLDKAYSHATQATSLNLTEMLSVDEDFSSADSKLNDARVTVEGYRVKPDIAPMLRGIISKHGDIAAHCKKSSTFCSLLLENVCNIVQKLKAREFLHLTSVEVHSFRDLIEDIESDDINVAWLHQRLDEINEAKRLLRESPIVKLAKMQNHRAAEQKEEEIKGYEEEICKLQQKINSAKEEMEQRRADKRKFDDILSHTKVQVKRFHVGSLTDGLF